MKTFVSTLFLSFSLLVCGLGSCATAPRLAGTAAVDPISITASSADSVLLSSDSIVVRWLSARGCNITQHNSLRLLYTGHEKFEDLFAAIDTAQQSIHLEYFNFRNDSIARELFHHLAGRAAQGVEVRAVFDAFGNTSNDSPLKQRHLDSIRALGIEIVKFDPIRFPFVNHVWSRDHRKIVVIDGKIAYIGGMNVADYYINGKPEIGPWHDLHVRLQGEVVAPVQKLFLEMWNSSTGQSIDGAQYFPGVDSLTETKVLPIAIVERTPGSKPRVIREAYVESIKSARHSLRIINPYFVPTHSVFKALEQALARGVDVQILVSSRSDIPFTPDAMLHKLRRLQKQGAKVSLYGEGFYHAKVMMVDGSFVTLGSTNLNSRSLRYDYEVNAFVFDRGVTTQLDSLFDRDREVSVPLTDDYWHKRSVWRKFVGWFANLFTPFL